MWGALMVFQYFHRQFFIYNGNIVSGVKGAIGKKTLLKDIELITSEDTQMKRILTKNIIKGAAYEKQ